MPISEIVGNLNIKYNEEITVIKKKATLYFSDPFSSY